MYKYFICMYVCMCTMCVPGAYSNQKRDTEFLGLESWMAVSHPMWVLGIKEPKPGLQQDQHALVSTDSSLQPSK